MFRNEHGNLHLNLQGCDYKDVYIYPGYSEIESRSEVDISIDLPRDIHGNPWKIQVPVISSNMDTVTGGRMAEAMYDAGGLGALHRFMTIEENVKEYKLVRGVREPSDCFVSVGVNRDSKERTQALYDAGARYFVIDIAHGHSKMMKDMVTWIKSNYPDVFLMAGNVATTYGAFDLVSWGADAVKAGIGPGAVCLTKNVTGVTVPQLEAVANVAHGVMEGWLRKGGPRSGKNLPLVIADGGIKEYGDIAKAIGAGADFVMIGSLFSGTDETPGDLVENKKVYRGMASKGAMSVIRDSESMPTPEGTSILVERKGPIRNIVNDIAGALKSSFSYCNATNVSKFRENIYFGKRK